MSSEYRQRYANKILAEEIVSGIIARKKAAELVAPLSGMEDVSGVASQLCRMLSAMPADYCDDFVAQLQELPCPLSVCVLAEFDPTEIASDADVASDVAATSWDGVTFEHAKEYVLAENTTDDMYARYMALLKDHRPDLFELVSGMLAEEAAKKSAEDKQAAAAEKKAAAAAEKKAAAEAAAEKKTPEAKQSGHKHKADEASDKPAAVKAESAKVTEPKAESTAKSEKANG